METDANVARHFSKSSEFLGRQSGTGPCDAGGAKGGDKFERVVRAYGSAVYRLALAQTRNRADAEDVFQEVFVALVRRTLDVGRSFESEEHLRAWLLRGHRAGESGRSRWCAA